MELHDFFISPFCVITPVEKQLQIYLRCFSQPRQISGLSSALNRLSVNSQLTCITDKRTDGH